MPELTLKQERFAEAYVATQGNQTQAAIQAGYSPKAAYQSGYVNMKNSEVRDAIAKKIKPIYTPERLRERLTEIIEAPDNQNVAVRAIELGMRSEAMLTEKTVNENWDMGREELDKKAAELALKLLKEADSVEVTKVSYNV